MKNFFLVSGIILFSIGLASFGWLENDRSKVDFVYDLSSRYMRTYTKTEIAQVRSVAEFESPEKNNQIVSYRSVVVSTFDDRYEPIIEVAGETAEFNDAQLKMLRSVNYSDDVLVRTEYMIKEDGKVVEGYTTPHITIVPETQATYNGGNQKFLSYLKSNSLTLTKELDQDELKPGKVRFTIGVNGVIIKTNLISTCGYPKIDQKMVDLINQAPGKWTSALNANGENVEEQLVFSFGIIGC